MRLKFTGAAQTVTGSRHLISLNGASFLLECGLYQGRREDTYARNLSFPFNPKDIRTVVLSHAHLDHCGNLPNLVRQGFTGKIHATAATAQLADITLRDSGHIQEADIEYLAKKQARHGGPPPRKPLYTVADAEQAIRLLACQDYDRPFQPLPGVTASFVEAGHILGSAGVVLELEEKGRKVRLMFSGDIGRPGMPILRDPVLPGDVDYLLMECTYGDTPHDPPEKAYEALRSVITRTVGRGGKLIIPSFAIGRTQLLVYELHEMIDRREVPRIPVFVDSPLAVNATEIFKDHPEIFDEQTQEFIRTDSHRQALGFDLLTYTQSVEESKAINDLKGPLVIISASGMAETGRILHHLRNNIQDPKNTILITSWMAPDTLGRRLADGQKRVRIFGEEFPVNAEVVKIDGFSAHAGQDFLVTYARAVQGRAKRIFLVHGEAGPAQALKDKLSDLGIPIDYPALGSEVEL
jgi:metallo-beta-lactamase family protein